MVLFKTFKSWKNFILSAIKSVFVGLLRILWSIILGVISIFAAIWKSVKAFCRREFAASLIIAAIFGVIGILWLGTFVKERTARVNAEYQRDSLSLKLDSAKQNAFIGEPRGINHWDIDE